MIGGSGVCPVGRDEINYGRSVLQTGEAGGQGRVTVVAVPSSSQIIPNHAGGLFRNHDRRGIGVGGW